MSPTETLFPESVVRDSVTPEAPSTKHQIPQIHLQTKQHDELLDLIDTLRSQGITNYIDLPQLIVCGDQSAGKSSVLEALSGGLRFPTKDSLCTRFAIELVLKRSPTSQVNIEIIPDKERPPKERESLATFQPPSISLEAFPEIIDAAAKAMGIDATEKPFSNDVLRVELCGPTQPHLTLVDLPGLYHAGSKNQPKWQAGVIHDLVKFYMNKKRSIILAVVSAMNDYNNQIVTEYAQSADPSGERTMGIITKPDTMHSGSHTLNEFQSLLKDEGTCFKLGWHVLRNRDYNARNSTTTERDKAEEVFFRGKDWKRMPKDRMGINALRKRLSETLFNHILTELPQLLKDVQNGVKDCEDRLQSLGSSRLTLESQRAYLFHASREFSALLQASIDGTYRAAFFGSSDSQKGYQKRLRAVVQNILKGFADEMRLRGHAVELVDYVPDRNGSQKTYPSLTNREEFLKYVELRMSRNRGRELSGTFNPDIIGDLFIDQAKPWKGIMEYTRDLLLQGAEKTISLLLDHVIDPVTAQAIQFYMIQPNMEIISKALTDKVDEVLRPHLTGSPSTFNHYFIENIQKKRRQETQKALSSRLAAFFGKDPQAQLDSNRIYDGKFDVRALLDSLVLSTEADFGRFACVEATNAMEAYYKVALKTVIDTYSTYAIEASLLGNLMTVFNPEAVRDLDDGTITAIASESAESISERDSLEKQLLTLQQSLKTLQRMKIRQVSDLMAPESPTPISQWHDRNIKLTVDDVSARGKRSSRSISQDSAIGIDVESV